MKILVADDTIVNRRILEALLGKDGHTVVLAEDGKQAVALFEQEQPDLVIMDLMMPEMDGYQATKLIKQQTGSRFVPVIFLTAVTNEDVLAKCIAHGGDDFLTKPYNHTILRAKIAAWERIQNLHATVTAQKDELEGHHARFLHEQDVASTIRNNVLGGGCLDQIGINYHLAPAATLSGDLILAATHPTGVLHLMIGDFTGHGLSAAIGALPVADIFYRMTERGFTLRDILIELNRKLKRTLPTGLFCAASLVELDARRGSAAIWNGGLPDVLVFNSGAGCRLQVPSQHPPLGVLDEADLHTGMQEVSLEPGDRLYLYSDGVIEACNPTGNQFGESRLIEGLTNNREPDRLFDEILASLTSFTAGTVQQDDVTLVELPCDLITARLLAPETTAPPQPPWPLEWRMELSLSPDAVRAVDPVPELLQILNQVPGLPQHKERLFTILAELMTNAIDHGLLGLDSSLKHSPEGFDAYYRERDARLAELRDGQVRIALTHVPLHRGSQLTIRIEDSGPGFDFTRPNTDLAMNDTGAGRGIALISSLCQKINFHGKGNCVEVVYALEPAA
ncbi:putative Histidine kinase with protein phosphatase region [Nitrospira defluvii]|jgi:CheY-like chemotaxis protein|uniref:Putative Histidine kinase with protein phosphatase region n=1 Tax=Nitrospira defluvii TaxID=330214 RepID=D8PF30_9BACT|nr:putative Histidine kinase with protein phosphatase region [Nitrospira defluvii]